MPVFYTFPPVGVAYPYVLCNARSFKQCWRYLLRHRFTVKSVIIDSGVELFRDPRVKDYPHGARYWVGYVYGLWRKTRETLRSAEVYVTVPDYPDDYNPKSLWLSENVTNIERTVENVRYALEKYPDAEWLIPVQGHYRSPQSLVRSLELLDELGALDKRRYLAIANLCVETDASIIAGGVRAVHSWLAENKRATYRLHVFGVKIAVLKRIASLIHSFDSTAWTRPVNRKLHDEHPYSAKTAEQRELFFNAYLERLKQLGITVS